MDSVISSKFHQLCSILLSFLCHHAEGSGILNFLEVNNRLNRIDRNNVASAFSCLKLKRSSLCSGMHFIEEQVPHVAVLDLGVKTLSL